MNNSQWLHLLRCHRHFDFLSAKALEKSYVSVLRSDNDGEICATVCHKSAASSLNFNSLNFKAEVKMNQIVCTLSKYTSFHHRLRQRPAIYIFNFTAHRHASCNAAGFNTSYFQQFANVMGCGIAFYRVIGR